MLDVIIKTTNVALSILWLAVILSLFSFFSGSYNSILIKIGVFLLAVHLIEYITVKLKTGKEINFIKTLLYGFGHWLPIVKK